jgi:cell division protein FtsB
MDKVSYRSNGIPRREVKKAIAPALFSNFFVKVGFILISAFLLYNVTHSIDITVQKVDILKNARLEVEKLRVTNLTLATQLQNMQSPEYIEVEARDRLNFSGNKDLVFVIPESLLSTAKERLDGILNEKPIASEKSVLQQWGELLIQGV